MSIQGRIFHATVGADNKYVPACYSVVRIVQADNARGYGDRVVHVGETTGISQNV